MIEFLNCDAFQFTYVVIPAFSTAFGTFGSVPTPALGAYVLIPAISVILLNSEHLISLVSTAKVAIPEDEFFFSGHENFVSKN